MSTFSARSTSEETWWEVQHRHPNDAYPHAKEWATTDVLQFGKEAVALVVAAWDGNAGTLRRNGRFRSSEAATAFLTRFAQAAECHKTTEFRVARVSARIEVEGVLTVAPPPICGHYGYYGKTRGALDLYCQQPPDHDGKHGPREEAA